MRIDRQKLASGHLVLPRERAEGERDLRSSPSGCKLATLGQGGVNEGPAHVPPLLDVSRADDDHVGRNAQAAQCAAQTDGLPAWVLDVRLDIA